MLRQLRCHDIVIRLCFILWLLEGVLWTLLFCFFMFAFTFFGVARVEGLRIMEDLKCACMSSLGLFVINSFQLQFLFAPPPPPTLTPSPSSLTGQFNGYQNIHYFLQFSFSFKMSISFVIRFLFPCRNRPCPTARIMSVANVRPLVMVIIKS